MNTIKKTIGLVVSWIFCSAFAQAESIDTLKEASVCYDFSCKTSVVVQFSEQDWNKVVGLFYLNSDAIEERQRILEAVATLETIVGTYTPTHRDVGKNWPLENNGPINKSGQMDCIDESINTTTYLKLLESEGLLKYHLVRKRAYRQSILNQHWAAQIVDTRNGQHYVIDSWFKDNGELPILTTSEVWHDLSLF